MTDDDVTRGMLVLEIGREEPVMRVIGVLESEPRQCECAWIDSSGKRHVAAFAVSRLARVRVDVPALDQGNHKTREDGMCAMEAVAYVACEPHGDHPKCADAALTAAMIRVNDRWSNADRQKLVPLIPTLVGTRGSAALARRRAWFMVDHAIRSNLPAFLRELPGKPRPDLAERFESLPPILDERTALLARDLSRAVRDGLREDAAVAAAYADAVAADAVAAAAVAAAAVAAAYAADAAYAAYAAAAVAAAAVAAAYAADAAYAAYAYAAAWTAFRERAQERTLEMLRGAIAITEDA